MFSAIGYSTSLWKSLLLARRSILKMLATGAVSWLRDSVHEYFRTLSIAPRTENRAEKRATFWTRRHTSREKKPVLSFLSRSSNCSKRCITNEQGALVEFSKYFHVNLLDFSTGLTTKQAMLYIMETDVLIGLHGAGLGFTSVLPYRAMVVELRSRYGERFLYFMNMAPSLNLLHHAVSLRGPRIGRAPSDVFTLPVGRQNVAFTT